MLSMVVVQLLLVATIVCHRRSRVVTSRQMPRKKGAKTGKKTNERVWETREEKTDKRWYDEELFRYCTHSSDDLVENPHSWYPPVFICGQKQGRPPPAVLFFLLA